MNRRMKLKTTAIFTKRPRKKIKIQRISTIINNIIFDKLRLNNKIENK